MLGWLRLLTPPRSLEAELEEYERADPRRTDVLAWLASAWIASLSTLRLLESILFALVVFVVLFRFRASARVIRAALWTPALACLLLYLLWTTAVTVAHLPPIDGWRDLHALVPERRFLIPLMLVPVLHRWRLLLLGLVAGGAIEVAAMLVRAALRASVWPELSVELTDGTQWTLIALVAAGAFAAVSAERGARIIGATFALLALGLQGSLTQRAPFAGSLFALLAVAVLGYRFLRPRVRVALAILAPVLLALAIGASILGGGVAAKRLESLSSLASYERLNDYTSSRLELWRLTLRAAAEAPIVGHGRGTWRAEIDRVALAEPEQTAAIQRIVDAREIRYSHNTVLDVLFESGAVGLVLLGTTIVLGLRGAFRRLPGETIAVIPIAAFLGVLVASQFEFVIARSIQGATAFTLGVLVLMPRPSASQWERSGLGRSDGWISRLFGSR